MQIHFTVTMGIEVKTSRLMQIIEADPDYPVIFGAFVNMGSKNKKVQLRGFPNATTLPPQVVTINNWDFDPKKPTNIITINIIVLLPPIKGSVIVAHSDPEAYPIVEYNELNTEQKELIVDSYLEFYKIIQQTREKDPNGIFDVVYPPENIFNIQDIGEKRRELLRYGIAYVDIWPGYGGICQMSRSINDGVVDSYLRVFGVDRLRVADLCVAPIVPDCNTCVPSMMIGLNASRIIKANQYQNQF